MNFKILMLAIFTVIVSTTVIADNPFFCGISNTCTYPYGCVDMDNDGQYGKTLTCRDGKDCDDNNSEVFKGKKENCDNIDNDCDGKIDEGFGPDTCNFICEGRGYTWVGNGKQRNCCGDDGREARPYEVHERSCNDGQDNDCDRLKDEKDPDCNQNCVDNDNDGHYAIDPFCNYPDADDCNDNDPQIFPHHFDLCDGKDNDCDGRIDEFFGPDTCTFVCAAQGYIWVGNGQERNCCGDDRREANPYEVNELSCNDGQDNDCDRKIDSKDPDCNEHCVDNDSDGYYAINPLCTLNPSDDCNDNDANVYPGHSETCDGKDNNCNGRTDEGFGNDQCSFVCSANNHVWVGNGNQLNCCGDDAREANPYEIIELSCTDRQDNDCDGKIDSKDMDCNEHCVDNDSDGHYAINPLCTLNPSDDCNDNDANVYPGHSETCDGKDNNCNGRTDEGFGNDQCTFVCSANNHVWVGNGNQLNCCGDDAREANPYEIIELSCTDRQDNDCDGKIDSKDTDCLINDCVDRDYDGYYAYHPFYCSEGNDCDDLNPNTNPGAIEICDGMDNNCNNDIDEGLTHDECSFVCEKRDYVWVNNGGELNCCGDDPLENSPYEVTELSCNDGHDNDCNGLIDLFDPNCPREECLDLDGDGHYGISQICLGGDDCDDYDPDRFPGNVERNDEKDQNCVDDPAKWFSLTNKFIPMNSRDGTDVYNKILRQCEDLDNQIEMKVLTNFDKYELKIVGDDLEIYNLEQNYFDNGRKISLDCNDVTEAFELTITQINNGPIFVSRPNKFVRLRDYDSIVMYRYQVKAEDVNGDALTYSLKRSPDSMEINQVTGLVRWQVSSEDIGKHQVVVRVSDGKETSEQEYTLTISGPTRDNSGFGEGIHIKRFLIDEDIVKPGDSVIIYVKFENQGNYRMDDVRATATIVDMYDSVGSYNGILRQQVGLRGLSTGDAVATQLELIIPDNVEPGYYLVKLTISEDNSKRVKYRDIRVE